MYNVSVPFFMNNFLVYVLCILYIYEKIVGNEGQEIMEYVYVGPICS